MIKIRCSELSIEASGHAGYAPAGGDIVCAAVSALMGALEAAVNCRADFLPAVTKNTKTPSIRVGCAPDEDSTRECESIFETISGGLELVAASYPEYVELKRI